MVGGSYQSNKVRSIQQVAHACDAHHSPTQNSFGLLTCSNCAPGHFGPGCSRSCPSADRCDGGCSSGGVCDESTSTCSCFDHFTGASCSECKAPTRDDPRTPIHDCDSCLDNYWGKDCNPCPGIVEKTEAEWRWLYGEHEVGGMTNCSVFSHIPRHSLAPK